jgi:hypothetical protein
MVAFTKIKNGQLSRQKSKWPPVVTYIQDAKLTTVLLLIITQNIYLQINYLQFYRRLNPD